MRARTIQWSTRTLTRRDRWLIVLVAVAVAFAGQLMPERTKAATLVDVPESAVVASCNPAAKVDQTPAFLAWLKAHDDPGTTIRFKAGGCYWMNNVVDILNLHDLTFDGNGAVFKTYSAGYDMRPSDQRLNRVWPRLRSMWRFEGGYNLVLKNMTILGSNGGPNAAIDPRNGRPFRWDFYCPDVDQPDTFCMEGQAGVTLFGVNHENKGQWGAKVENVKVQYVFGDSINLHGWGDHMPNRRIEVRNSTFERAGRIGVVPQVVNGALFENNVIITPRRSMTVIEPWAPNQGSFNVTFDHNRFIDQDDPTDTKTGHAYMFANGGNTDARVENITYSNNTLLNQQVTTYINLGPQLSRRHTSRKNIRIINNTSDITVGSPFPDQAPIRAAGIVGLEVRGNRQPIQPNQRNFGVSVYGAGDGPSSGIVVKDNHFANALGGLYTDPAIPAATVCNNRVGLDSSVDRACAVTPTVRPNPPPKIMVPSAGAAISGNTIVSAATAFSARRVEYLISGRPFFYLAHLGDAKETPYGWVYTWSSQKVPDGTYWLKARSYDPLGNHQDGPQIEVQVRNTLGG
jgi:hypothetical protein